MNGCKRLIIFAAFFTTSCFVGIKAFEHNESVLVKAVIQILESCYANRITAVGLAGNSTGMISEALSHQGNPLITLIDGAARKTNNGPVNPQYRYRLQVFVITASSSMDLSMTLNVIKTSIWWNHMAAFLVLDWQLSKEGCNNAFEMLWATWEMNLLNVKFLCHHWTKGRLIYTFNPYTNWAPEPWQFDESYSGKNDHPWNLFVREYEEDGAKICNKLDFEKANDLGGYHIRVSATYYGHELVNSNRICPGVFDNVRCQILFPALNATPIVRVHSALNSVGHVDEKGNFIGILAEIFHGFSDIGVLGQSLTNRKNLSMIYPHYQYELRSLTQYSGYKSQLSKIQDVIDRNSRLCLYLVCVITVLFFKYFERQSVTVAHLSTFRVICNSSLPKISEKFGQRFYLGSLFLFALTMQGIYQGQLASLLTKQEPLRDVNSMRDLAERGHTIYGTPSYGSYFRDPAFEGRFVPADRVQCTEYVLRSPSAACVGNAMLLFYDAVKFRLHISREPLGLFYVALPIRSEWPLEQRVNTLLRRSIHTGILKHSIDNIHYHTYRHLRFQENEHKDQNAKVLTLKQLGFAFAILGIGLGFAIVVFIVEKIW